VIGRKNLINYHKNIQNYKAQNKSPPLSKKVEFQSRLLNLKQLYNKNRYK
jgi:hypothetical protein